MKLILSIGCFLILTTFYIHAQSIDHSGNRKRKKNSFDKGEKVYDVDGNPYRTVKIGDQTWMTENLKTTRFSDGTAIEHIGEFSMWNLVRHPARCWYNNDSLKHKDKYGALYNWYAVNTDQLCPAGWHVPSDSEWIALKEYVIKAGVAKFEEGSALKAKKAWNMQYDKSAITDAFGFSALPAGERGSVRDFDKMHYATYWWSSTSWSRLYAWSFALVSDNDIITRSQTNKSSGFSVRCIKDRSQ
ncbi:MAG: fibrobacter succinogenes major paralogous domain-containing protein [Bacteroidales bacterium]|nr:fibrobacter succinogenes major paralogous domain-containing protein [Bacteroidales bacterium]MBN2763828.1 fibrobacter succinogenes major paralogous domain-containing protein [Bacteroidales bacterium]